MRFSNRTFARAIESKYSHGQCRSNLQSHFFGRTQWGPGAGSGPAWPLGRKGPTGTVCRWRPNPQSDSAACMPHHVWLVLVLV